MNLSLQSLGSALAYPLRSLMGYGEVNRIARTRTQQLIHLERHMASIRARFDAAQTVAGNEKHWSNADNMDPHSVANLSVRQKLRSRSRYEVIENNPYLKGIILTICNDFVGSGPKLQITDKRLSEAQRQAIEDMWQDWCILRKVRQKLWRMRMAKIVDGESFALAYTSSKENHPITLDFQIIECDRITSDYLNPVDEFEVDGVRFDEHENPIAYYVRETHPGGVIFNMRNSLKGRWVSADRIIHWFRQDRGWLRGIPETAASLPLCALLRRYTLACVAHAEVAANLTGIFETQNPASNALWSDGAGNLTEDDPFDIFPIEHGMFMNLPWGYTMKQLNATPLGSMYDDFVSSLLREITRPLLVPFNVAAGTSKDSNMASAIVDTNIYQGGQYNERYHCGESVLDSMLQLFWNELTLRMREGTLGDTESITDSTLIPRTPAGYQPLPRHYWRWDKIGLDHTDPEKVANAIKILRDEKIITDRDIQEKYYNRTVEEWRAEVERDDEFRAAHPTVDEQSAQAKVKTAEKVSSPQGNGDAAAELMLSSLLDTEME